MGLQSAPAAAAKRRKERPGTRKRPNQVVATIKVGISERTEVWGRSKAMGAKVVAGTSTQDKLDLALSFGADTGVLYSTPDWRADLKEILDNEKLTMVYDPVGGEISDPAFRSLSPGGRFLVVGFASGSIPSIALNLPLLKQSAIVGVDWGGAMRANPKLTPQLQSTLFEWIEEGRLIPAAVSTRPLSEASAALADQITGKVIGKLVLKGGE